ncbi:zf-TFIIB domain-containing protein [Maritalea mobilis]|uniref:TFIIB-type zinc ribbon-containing protein n=1 Tax=Maritalea mobilis TaxID=483324 RepID=UPI001C95D870|nr:zf-TFIIB domain-containing protein [Maritalea mobilis]MBY6202804.1 zf-TFIIB domain-containing protein [Maritalea mobilis]
MKCPVDGTPMLMSERQGVEIDYCPHCRGVWLDRGELDKIIERSSPGPAEERHSTEAPRQKPRDEDRPWSFLDDIFDF